MNVGCRWRPHVHVAVTRHFQCIIIILEKRWLYSKVSKTSDPRAVEVSRCCNCQLWCHRVVGYQSDDVISEIATWVKPSHDWSPAAVVRNTTRHRDNVILQHGFGCWQVCCTLRVALCSIEDINVQNPWADTGLTGVTCHPLSEREKYLTKNITSQATQLANSFIKA